MSALFFAAVLVVSLVGRLLDGAVHQFDLAIGPRVVGLRHSVFDPVCLGVYVAVHWPRIVGDAVSVLVCELDAIRREDGCDLIGHGFKQVMQELPAVFLSAILMSRATANLEVRSMPTNR